MDSFSKGFVIASWPYEISKHLEQSHEVKLVVTF